MNQSSFKTAEVIDLDTLTNSRVVVGNVGDSVGDQASRPVGTGNGENVAVLSSSSNPHTPISANRGLASSLTPLDFTRPVKTEAEASPSMSTVSHPPPPDGASILSASQPAGAPLSGSTGPQAASGESPSPSLPVSVASISTLGTFGSPLTALGAQLNLTSEEQSAAYRKANILALSALAKKGGPNAREMLAVQAKLQEFLTNLISLAGNSGQQLKSTVQMLVQQLVTGSISEQEFAMRIERDLHSQHQPSLLPFLQNSVPHLRTRLQLQQAIMKELLQRQAQEKLQRKLQEQKQVTVPSLSAASGGASNSIHGADKSQLAVVDMVGPASASGTVGQTLTQQHPKLNNVASNVSNSSRTVPSSSSSSSSAPSPGSVPLPISTTSLTAQLREQLAKITPQQRQLYMQQLAQVKLVKPQHTQQNVTSSPSSVHLAKANNSMSVSPLNSSTVKVTAQAVGVSVQQVSVGTVAVKPISSRVPISSASPNATSNHLGASSSRTVGTNLSPSRGGPLRTGFVDVKLAPSSSKSASPPSSSTSKGKGKVKTETGKNAADDDEEEDDEMDFSGVKTVNLQAESILPTNFGETMRTVRDEAFFDLRPLKQKVLPIAQRFGICDVADDFMVLLSHGLQERLKDVLEKVTVVSQHRTESLKDESDYEVTSEVKGQLKVLESIDRMSHRRKQEREKDKILKAARSRSRAEDPEAAAKIKEQAKKLQQEEAQKIRDKRANEAALAALTAISGGTKRKRPSEAVSSSLSSQEAGSGHTSLLGAQTNRQPKRRVTARDLLFYMEQTKETKKSLILYKSLLK